MHRLALEFLDPRDCPAVLDVTGGVQEVAYKDVPGFPHYRVGDDGSVWTRWANSNVTPTESSEWREMARIVSKRGGYLVVNLNAAGKRTKFKIHRLVLWLFKGPCPDGMEGCHNDGDRTNNRISNLRWDTRVGNQADRTRHGSDSRGTRNGLAKLNDVSALEIRKRRSNGESKASLAREYGVTEGTVYAIVIGKTWRHVDAKV